MTAPLPTVFAQGQGSVTGDNLNTFVQVATNAAQLRTFVGLSNMVVNLLGIATPNDGGAGLFYWNSSGTTADDNMNFIVPPAAVAGEWVRLTNPSGSLVLAGDVTGPLGANVIAALAVTAAKIALGAVGTAQLANLAVTAAKIANGGVGTAQIANAAVTNALLALMPSQTVKANVSGGTGAPADVPISTFAAPALAAASGVAQQGILFDASASNIKSFGGVTVTRTSIGLFSLTLGGTPLNMGYMMCTPSQDSGFFNIDVSGPNSTMIAGGNYSVNFRNNTTGNQTDPVRALCLFY